MIKDHAGSCSVNGLIYCIEVVDFHKVQDENISSTKLAIEIVHGYCE